MFSAHHIDVPWCIVGNIHIMYHATVTVSTSVQYDQRTVFGSHGAYAVWTGTDPRSFSVSANFVGANALETAFNLGQIQAAYDWTQESPPQCKKIMLPSAVAANSLFGTEVRIESFDGTIPDTVHIYGLAPVQIDFSLSLKECKAI